jgi:NADP-dependent 3-hydroxy acid dehydrogenase YdfG
LKGAFLVALPDAKLCASEGAQVTITSRNQDKLNRAASVIGAGCRQAVLDMTDEKAVEAFLTGMGGIDHLLLTQAGWRATWFS